MPLAGEIDKLKPQGDHHQDSGQAGKEPRPRAGQVPRERQAHDFEKTTSNGAEQENSRLKTLLIRSMMLLDMLDAVC